LFSLQDIKVFARPIVIGYSQILKVWRLKGGYNITLFWIRTVRFTVVLIAKTWKLSIIPLTITFIAILSVFIFHPVLLWYWIR